MVLEAHVVLCVTELDLLKKILCPRNGENEPKMDQNRVFWIIGKFRHWLFLNVVYNERLYYLLHSCIKSIFGSWDMGKNALDQSDCRIFKSAISLEQNDEQAWFCACCYRFIEINSWYKNIGVGMIKNGYGHSGHKTLKLAVSQEGINGINWYLVCWYKFRKAKKSVIIFGCSCSKMGLAF